MNQPGMNLEVGQEKKILFGYCRVRLFSSATPTLFFLFNTFVETPPPSELTDLKAMRFFLSFSSDLKAIRFWG
jgi:hypothetical protein